MAQAPFSTSDLQFLETADGSYTLFNPIINERYHSKHGAKAESAWVFIKQGLAYMVEELKANEVTILEVGFGTGLNALLTFNYFKESKINNPALKLNYIGLETFPLPEEIWGKLNYTTEEETERFHSLHSSVWNEATELVKDFHFTKLNKSILEIEKEALPHFHLIYFDAFAPEKQAEMWENAVFEKLFELMLPQAALVTYCAKGVFKRSLKSIGFEVQSLPGPPFKKEMVRAIKI